MRYSPSSVDLVPSRRTEDEGTVSVLKSVFALSDHPTITRNLSELARSHTHVKKSVIKQRLSKEMEKHIKRRKQEESFKKAKEALDDYTEDEALAEEAEGAELGSTVLEGAFETFMEAIFAPILEFGWAVLVELAEVLLVGLVECVIVPIAAGIAGLIAAFPIAAAVIGIAAVVGGAGYYVYKKYQEKKAYTPTSVAPLVDSTQVASMPIDTSPIMGAPSGKSDKNAKQLLSKQSRVVRDAITNAAKVVGVDRDTLVAFAGVESSFDPNAGASTTSAKGLFQFLGSTWADTVASYGKRYGVPANASVYNPTYNALMGAAYLKHVLMPSMSGMTRVTSQDLYFSHFLGPGDGPKFIKAVRLTPNAIAATAFPKSARDNPWVFYNGYTDKKTKRFVKTTPKTYKEIYDFTGGKIASLQMAAAEETQPTTEAVALGSGFNETPRNSMMLAQLSSDQASSSTGTSAPSSQSTQVIKGPRDTLIRVAT